MTSRGGVYSSSSMFRLDCRLRIRLLGRMGRLFVGRELGTSGRMLCGSRRGRRGGCRGMWRGVMRACLFGWDGLWQRVKGEER